MTRSGEHDLLTSWREREASLYRVFPYGGLTLGTLLALVAPAPGPSPPRPPSRSPWRPGAGSPGSLQCIPAGRAGAG
ncbi:hypothetical protein NKG94_39400 [Micromonospora sp. M12]